MKIWNSLLKLFYLCLKSSQVSFGAEREGNYGRLPIYYLFKAFLPHLQCPMCVFGNTDEPKPDAPASDTETTSEAESKA